jgi:hypothetical protein
MRHYEVTLILDPGLGEQPSTRENDRRLNFAQPVSHHTRPWLEKKDGRGESFGSVQM